MTDNYQEKFKQDREKALERLYVIGSISNIPDGYLFHLPGLENLTEEEIFKHFKFEHLRQYLDKLEDPTEMDWISANMLLGYMDAIYRCISVRYLSRTRAEVLTQHREKLRELYRLIGKHLGLQ